MEYPQRSYQFNLATYISRDDFIKFHPMTDHVEFMPVKTGQYPLPRPASPSPTSRRKISARPFHNTGILARRTGVTLAAVGPAGRELRGLDLRGSPLGTRVRPVSARI